MAKRSRQTKSSKGSMDLIVLKNKKTKLLLQIGECEMTITSYSLRKEDLKREFAETHSEIKKRETK